ncbi:MAG: DUF2061 domain-containing protein [Rickettsiales bacterium]
MKNSKKSVLSKTPIAKLGAISVKGSIMRAIIYTCGHIVIAMTCNKLITDTSLELATLDAIIEPIINGFWFFFLDRIWSKNK